MKNKKLRIVIILVVLFIIILILNGMLSYMEKNEVEEDKHKGAFNSEIVPMYKNPNDEEYVEEKNVKNSNITVLQDLKGGLPISTVISKVNTVFVDNLPKVLEEIDGFNDSKLKEYYAKNETSIRTNLRIDTEKSFLNMAKKFSTMTSNFKTDYKACDFTDEDGLGFTFSYENGEEVKCKIIGENANTVMFEF